MTNWETIGIKRFGAAWQLFPRAVTGTEVFRLQHSLTGKRPFRTYGLISQFFFSNSDTVGVRRVYPIFDSNPIINLQIPEHLRQAGYLSRFIGIKLPKHLAIHERSLIWTVKLEELLDSEVDRIDMISAKIDALI